MAKMSGSAGRETNRGYYTDLIIVSPDDIDITGDGSEVLVGLFVANVSGADDLRLIFPNKG